MHHDFLHFFCLLDHLHQSVSSATADPVRFRKPLLNTTTTYHHSIGSHKTRLALVPLMTGPLTLTRRFLKENWSSEFPSFQKVQFPVKDNAANLRKYASLNRHLKVVNGTIFSYQLISPKILIDSKSVGQNTKCVGGKVI